MNKIMKKVVLSILTLLAIGIYTIQMAEAQSNVKLYDPSLDGMKQIREAVAQAKKSGKHVFIQYGGNWCPWCIKFDAFVKSDTGLTRIINQHYVPVKLNYDQTNRNYEANEYLGNPIRFGFPVFIILNGDGKVLHIQDSALLEEGEGYNRQKVYSFLNNWTPSAIIPVRKQ